jgi:hypothetical protein
MALCGGADPLPLCVYLARFLSLILSVPINSFSRSTFLHISCPSFLRTISFISCLSNNLLSRFVTPLSSFVCLLYFFLQHFVIPLVCPCRLLFVHSIPLILSCAFHPHSFFMSLLYSFHQHSITRRYQS